MKKWLASLTLGCALHMLPLHCAEPAAVQTEEKNPEIADEIDHLLISEALGHLISKNLSTLGSNFNMDRLIKGLKDATAGLPNPLSEEQTVEAIQKYQEKAFQKLANDNLRKAQEFLDFNAKNTNVISLESGKIQYVTLEKGEGASIEPHANPLIKYQARFLDGQVFGESKVGETISLDDTIPGFSKALIGMKEGEKRTIYIHPDLGYSGNGMLPPNSLLTFDVEVVKADVPEEKLDAAQNIADTDFMDLEGLETLK
ncbi:MAG: FKBP-type peptidyl-prolyl cis-trans isomerase [Chlamydiia bacterium]